MTNQVQGEILFKGIDSGAGQWVYTPWIEVLGDFATLAIEVTAISGVTLTWNVETRTAEDATTVVDVLSNQSANSVNVHWANSTGKAKQWIRFKFATGGTADLTKWVRVRALMPSWQVNR